MDVHTNLRSKEIRQTDMTMPNTGTRKTRFNENRVKRNTQNTTPEYKKFMKKWGETSDIHKLRKEKDASGIEEQEGNTRGKRKTAQRYSIG